MADRDRARGNEQIGSEPGNADTRTASSPMERGSDRAHDQGLGSSATKGGIDSSNREERGDLPDNATTREGTGAGGGSMPKEGGYGASTGFAQQQADGQSDASRARQEQGRSGGSSGSGHMAGGSERENREASGGSGDASSR